MICDECGCDEFTAYPKYRRIECDACGLEHTYRREPDGDEPTLRELDAEDRFKRQWVGRQIMKETS